MYSSLATVTRCTFDGNVAEGPESSGGALYFENGAVNMDRVSITNNIAGMFGGGIHLAGNVRLYLTRSYLSGCQVCVAGRVRFADSVVGRPCWEMHCTPHRFRMLCCRRCRSVFEGIMPLGCLCHAVGAWLSFRGVTTQVLPEW